MDQRATSVKCTADTFLFIYLFMPEFTCKDVHVYQEQKPDSLFRHRQREADKQKLIDEKRQAKVEVKTRKEEEKRKMEEEEQRKLQKAKSMFSSFFVKKPTEVEAEQEEQKEEDNKLFQEFRVCVYFPYSLPSQMFLWMWS